MSLGLGLGLDSAKGRVTPATILGASLKHWGEFDDSTLVSGNISVVNDKSGNGNTLTQTTGANRPLFVASGINGKGTGRFNGTSHHFIADWICDIISGTDQPFTIWYVLNKDDLATTDNIVGCGSSSSNTPFSILNLVTTPELRLARRDDASVSGTANGDAYAAATDLIVSINYSGTNAVFRQNGAAAGSGAADVGLITVDQGRVGVLERLALSGFFDGDMAALAMSNIDETAAKTAAVTNYFNTKYSTF